MYMFVQVETAGPGTVNHLYLLRHPHCPGPGEYLLQRSCSETGVDVLHHCSEQDLPGTIKESCLRIGGRMPFLFPYRGHTCPSSDAGAPHITIDVFLNPHCPVVLLHPHSILQVVLGVPLLKQKTTSLSFHKLLVKS